MITFAIIAAALVLNVLVQQLGWHIDMTDSSVYTLSDQTLNVLDELDEDVTMYLLADRNREDPRIMEILDRYARASNRIRVETIDAEQNPGFAQRFATDEAGLRNGSLIVASEDNFRAIQGFDLFSVDNRNPQAPQILGLNVERRVTNALMFVATGRTPIIYQITGHGELDLIRGGRLERLGEQFENANFEIRTLNLLQAPHVPDDGAAVALVRPRVDITVEEAEKLSAFLASGGKGFFALEFAAGELPNVAAVLEAYGIGIPLGVVLEPDRNLNAGRPITLVPRMADTDVTNPITEADFVVIADGVRPIVALDTKPRSVTIEPLLTTSQTSFYRTDLDIPISEGLTTGDVPGPHAVAVRAIEREFTTGDEITRLAVFGDVDLISLVDQVNGNLDFLMNTFGWLEEQEETLAIRPKTTLQFPMQTTGMQKLIFSVLFVVMIPLAILIAGIVTWVRRRHL